MNDDDAVLNSFDDSPNEDIIDEDLNVDYNIKGDYKHPILVMDGVKDAREKRAKEMNKGYYNFKFDKEGNAVKVWIPDERKEFIGAVRALQIIMSAELENDPKYKDFIEVIEKDISELYDKFSYESYTFDNVSNGWKKTGVKYMPQQDEDVLICNPSNPRFLVDAKGGWNGKMNAYYDKLVFIYDKIFSELCKVICRKNYYDEEAKF